MAKEKYDFCGWATRANVKCADGRTIMRDAFIDNDGMTVPIVWNHQHNDHFSVLGHALLKNRPEGVYTYGKFNDTESGRNAKLLVNNGDITALSIFANQLKHNGSNVTHGMIREVSLVLAGANPEAYIETVLQHGELSEDEAIMYFDNPIELSVDDISHSDEMEESEKTEEIEETIEHAEDAQKGESSMAKERTIKDVFDEMTEEQKTVVYAMVGEALAEAGVDTDEEGGTMKQNLFDMDEEMEEDYISHSDMMAVITDAKRYGSMKESALEHGITNIDYLFPDAQTLQDRPEFVARPMEWVSKVMNGVKHSPFARVKSIFADITGDDARARGYIKGNFKQEEVFSLLKRQTLPMTIYKKQKLHRDDVVDITDFDVVAWLKTEMRMMLDEEIARAILIGDGRNSSSDDKIDPQNIRPIWTDEDFFTIKTDVNPGTGTADEIAKSFIRTAIKARKDYRGSGKPTLYTYEDVLTDLLLLEDGDGRIIYDSETKLATMLRVKEIVTVPVMEDATNAHLRQDEDGVNHKLLGLIVNLQDYNVGADKGGAVNMFDDFDIDYNAQKYLIETRCSGAMIKPFGAIAIEMVIDD